MGVIRSHDITVIKEIEDSTLKLIPMTDEHLPLLYKWNEKTNVLYCVKAMMWIHITRRM